LADTAHDAPSLRVGRPHTAQLALPAQEEEVRLRRDNYRLPRQRPGSLYVRSQKISRVTAEFGGLRLECAGEEDGHVSPRLRTP
jgi:hypothetical protein